MAAKNTPSVEEHITCSICMEVYTNPLRLSCEHCFCKKCLLGLCSGDPGSKFQCPECRRHITVGRGGLDDFPKNLHLSNIVDTYRKQVRRFRVPAMVSVWVCETHKPLGELTICITCNRMTLCNDCQNHVIPRK
jgi:hypothetical protein